MTQDRNKSKKNDNSENTGRAKRILMTILGAVAIVAATVIIVLYVVDSRDTGLIDRPVESGRPVLPTGARGTIVTEENLDEIREQLSTPPEDATYSAVMSVEWTFERWDRPSRDAYIENSTANTRTVFFDVILDETEELIYSSPYIPVGRKLENFALDTVVPAGEYTATVVYFLVDDDNEVLTDVSVMVWLNILG